MSYQKIISKLHEVGFDEFYQAGSISRFHPLNIVATSKITNKQYWICVDGGYRCPETFHISYRELGNIKAISTRIQCKNQSEMVEQLGNIQLEIESLKVVALVFEFKCPEEIFDCSEILAAQEIIFKNNIYTFKRQNAGCERGVPKEVLNARVFRCDAESHELTVLYNDYELRYVETAYCRA